MKLFLKIIPLCLLSFNLNAEVFSVFLENDVINGEDKHYTNGVTFTYLSNKDTNNLVTYNNKFLDLISKIPTFNDDTKYQTLGMTFSHLTFTPNNTDTKEKIVNDSPYAGIATMDFILYKWEEDFFHEYILTLGMAGPSTLADEFQKEYHNITGNNETKGWNNQLKDEFLYNFAYSYGYKAFKHEFNYGKMDLINNFRIDAGNYNRAIMVGSMLRYGNNYPNNFNTVGKFIGANENKLLNLDSNTNKSFAWSISYGLGYTYTDYFYVNDYDKSYQLDELNDTLIQVISLDTYFEKLVISLSLKSANFIEVNHQNERETWGGVNIAYLF